MRKLKINSDLIEFAFESSQDLSNAYLDTETGEILHPEMEDPDSDRDETFWDEILGNERYVEIPRQTSHDGYLEMEDFIDTVEDEHLRELLEVAINGRGAFRRFKDVLASYPEERERWFKLKDDLEKRRIIKWLSTIDIEPIFE